VAVRPIPVSWLTALRPGGRLVTTITGTALILTADKTDDGGAIGRIEWNRAGFMSTRTGPDYPPARCSYSERTGKPVCSSNVGRSMNFRACGVGITQTVHPRAWARPTSSPMRAARREAQTTRYNIPCVVGSGMILEASSCGELFQLP
jgi:hypothetical protein